MLRDSSGAPVGNPFYVLIAVGPTPTPESGVHSHGYLPWHQTYTLDLDQGIEDPPEEDKDVRFNAEDVVPRFIRPQNDASFQKSEDQPSIADCADAQLVSGGIPISELEVGNWLCYGTNEGRLGRMQIINLGSPTSEIITISFLTWEQYMTATLACKN